MNNPILKKLCLYLPTLLLIPFLLVPFKFIVSTLFVALFALYLMVRFPFSRNTLAKLVWASFILRVIVIFVNDFVSLLPNQPDAMQYNTQAMRIVDNMSRHLPVFYNIPYSLSVKSYSFFLSLFYSIFGQVQLLAVLINSFLGILTGILIYKICRELFDDERIALLASGFTLFLPSIIAFTSYVLRDALVLYLTMALLYHLILLGKRRAAAKNASIVVLLFILISIIRIQNFYLYSGFAIIYASILILRSRKMPGIKLLLLIFIILLSVFIYQSHKDLIVTVMTYPFRAQPLRAIGGSAYLQNVKYHSFFDIIKYLPLRFFYFSFGPFLWNAHGSFLWLSALEGLVILVAAYLTFRYFWAARIQEHFNLQLLLLLFCLIGLLANSVVDSNFGTAVRHRMNYIIFLFIFASAYLRNYRIRLL